ncbi:unnamed protein product [Oppiella nova]|uniref:Acyltransferase 3 domain-containing protein n=1 Tax=Oppiella nova TaxID=334625 RepID=A0A7R9MBK1_9ACAR|nr:unnamed protein product [Oppiella nova]CAG2173825.1 unnamed protein product [Oppiella nova]
MGHAFTYTTSLGLIGLKRIFSEIMFKVYEDNEYIFVRNPLIIDALFTLSGLLLSYGVLRKLDKSGGRFNYPMFIFQRWLRFFILMFGALLFFYIFPLTGDGPVWHIGVGWVTPGCQNPRNLLKIDDIKEQLIIANSKVLHLKCNPPTWFLSSLLQLTLIGPCIQIIYLVPLHAQ